MDELIAFLAGSEMDEVEGYLMARTQLHNIGNAAIPFLTDLMLCGNFIQSYRAARLLGEFRDKRVIHSYLRALRSANALVRQHAVQFLGKHGDTSITPHLLERLGNDADYIQLTIVEAIGELADKRAVGSLLSLLKETTSSAIQQSIIRVLGKLGDENTASALIPFFESTDRHVRTRSREAYQQLLQR